MEIDKEVHDTLEGEVQYLRKEYAYLHRRFLDIEEKLEESEEKLLKFSHAYITLANPIARAKYDDELNQLHLYLMM